ncbi:uncharacterized protein LOC100206161 isoform X3 [Hydra vulgaris]|uniref:Uncharacterized protein LOC100206161 isoform X3 n=1 Tax=Hydra vulgaris TaxID=6087 RepID=A0ABM4B5X3_HYDVU
MNQLVNTASGGIRCKQTKKNVIQCEKKYLQAKNLDASFSLPYEENWPIINTIHQTMMLEEIFRVFQNNICHQFLLRKHKKLLLHHESLSLQIQNKLLKNMMLRKYCNITEEQAEDAVQSLYSNEKLKSTSPYLLFGINAVTKFIEKYGKLVLLIVCESAQPSLMTRHLMNVCLVHGIYACSINNLSKTISPFLDMKSVLAIGFKEVINSPFADLVEFLKDKIPTLDERPWSKLWEQTHFTEELNLNKKFKIEYDKISTIDHERKDDQKWYPDLLNLNVRWKAIKKKPKKPINLNK